MSVFDVVFVRVSFEVGVPAVGCGIAFAFGWGEGVALASKGACDATFLIIDGHAGVFGEYREFLQSDGHIGWEVSGEAEVIGEAVSGVVNRWFVGVGVSREGVWAKAPAADCESAAEGFEEESEKEWGGRGFLLSAAVVGDGGGGGIGGVVVCGGDTVALFACVNKGRAYRVRAYV
jgi:hypothetical protein